MKLIHKGILFTLLMTVLGVVNAQEGIAYRPEIDSFSVGGGEQAFALAPTDVAGDNIHAYLKPSSQAFELRYTPEGIKGNIELFGEGKATVKLAVFNKEGTQIGNADFSFSESPGKFVKRIDYNEGVKKEEAHTARLMLTSNGGQVLIKSIWLEPFARAEMADAMRADGKIYVVVLVAMVILIGLVVFVAVTGRRVGALQKKMEQL